MMTTQTAPTSVHEAVREVVQLAGYLLDHEQFPEWLDLFADDSRYELAVQSRDIGREIQWILHDKDSLTKRVLQIHEHVGDGARTTHVTAPVRVRISSDESEASVRSTFSVFRTSVRGETKLFGVGEYDDRLRIENGAWRITSRRVELQTTLLPEPTHVPL